MSTLRKVLKLLPPAFVMRIWLDRKYGMTVKPSPWGGAAGFALSLLPYAFTAALSVRMDTDVRLVKYFLPYGKMKNFVKLAYGVQRSNVARDRGAIGVLRAAMPYGLVIWWDDEDARLKAAKGGRDLKADPIPSNVPPADASCRITDKERQELERMDRIEALTLRCMITTERGLVEP